MSQFVTGVRAHTTSFVRKPLNLALLIVLPPVVIVVYGRALEAFSPLIMSFAGGAGTDLGTMGRLTGGVFATAFLTGIIGLFQVISARHGDERLVLCGFSRFGLLASRLVTVIGVALLATSVSFVVLVATVSVSSPLLAFGALLVGGVSYGLLGMCVGALIPRELEGSLVLVFLVDFDGALSSGMFETTTVLPKLFVLYRPHKLLESAAIDGTIDIGHAIGAGGVLLLLAGLVFLVYGRMTNGGGVGL